MESPEQTNTEHSHYWPDDLIPVTPQARRYGYVFDVYVTKRVWKDMCVWSEGQNLSTDKRLWQLLDSCYRGLGAALSVHDDFVSFTFRHWYKKKRKPKAKKMAKIKLGARLLLHPETEEPWLLLFDPEYDFTDQLKKGDAPDGEHEEDRTDEAGPGTVELPDSPRLDQSN